MHLSSLHFAQAPSSLPSSARAAMTKHRRLGGVRNRHRFLTVRKAEKPMVKVLADSVRSEGPFLVCRQLSSLCVPTWWTERAWIPFPLLLSHQSYWIRAHPAHLI